MIPFRGNPVEANVDIERIFKFALTPKGVSVPVEGAGVGFNFREEEVRASLKEFLSDVIFVLEEFNGLSHDAAVGHHPIRTNDGADATRVVLGRGAFTLGEGPFAEVAVDGHVVHQTAEKVAIATSAHPTDVELIAIFTVGVAIVGSEIACRDHRLFSRDVPGLHAVDGEMAAHTGFHRHRHVVPCVGVDGEVRRGMARQTVLRGVGEVTVLQVHAPTVVTLHHDELQTLVVVGVHPSREREVPFHRQVVVVVNHDVVALTVETKREVGTWPDLNNTVDGEVLGVVFQVVPRTGHDVAHVGAGDVDVVLIPALGGL